MAPRQDRTDARRDQILAAAEQIVADKGLDGLRMDEIADRTGISKGALYLSFESKGELTMAILDRTLQSPLAAVERLSPTEIGAEAALRRFADEVIGGIDALTRLLPISSSFLSLALRNPTVRASLQTYLHRYLDALVPIVQTGVDTGAFHPTDPHETAIAIAAVVEGTMLLWLYDPTAIDPARHIRSGLEHVLRGLTHHAPA